MSEAWRGMHRSFDCAQDDSGAGHIHAPDGRAKPPQSAGLRLSRLSPGRIPAIGGSQPTRASPTCVSADDRRTTEDGCRSDGPVLWGKILESAPLHVPTRPAERSSAASVANVYVVQSSGERCSPARTKAAGPTWFYSLGWRLRYFVYLKLLM